MKAIIKTAIFALTLVAGASAGHAETVWHFPYKGVPYATHVEPTWPVAHKEASAQRTRHYLLTAKRSHASKSVAGAR